MGEVEHQLTIGCGPRDIRVTVKYEKWEKVLLSESHEVGHGIHGWNRNQEWNGLPVNSYSWPSLGECNSRYTENKIGKSRAFWEYYYPTFQKETSGIFSDIELDHFYQVKKRAQTYQVLYQNVSLGKEFSPNNSRIKSAEDRVPRQ